MENERSRFEKFLVSLVDSVSVAVKFQKPLSNMPLQKVYNSNIVARLRILETKILSWDNSHENLRRRESTMNQQLSEKSCFCPLYRLWKVAGPGTSFLKTSIMPMIDKDGRVRRAIREVTLTVDRTASGEHKYNRHIREF